MFSDWHWSRWRMCFIPRSKIYWADWRGGGGHLHQFRWVRCWRQRATPPCEDKYKVIGLYQFRWVRCWRRCATPPCDDKYKVIRLYPTPVAKSTGQTQFFAFVFLKPQLQEKRNLCLATSATLLCLEGYTNSRRTSGGLSGMCTQSQVCNPLAIAYEAHEKSQVN